MRRLILLFSAAAAVVAAVVLRQARMRRLLRRYVTLGGVAGRAGGRTAVHLVRRVGAGEERRAELSAELQLRSAEDVARTLGGMKGAFMKVGQLASFVDDGLPEPVRAALAQLQDSATPMSAELAAGVVRDELGAAPEDLFREWDAMPVAAASIGQVHRAVCHDGTEVAVKVQYPGIAELVEADLAQLDLGRFVLPTIYPDMDVQAVTTELRDRLTEEVDYRIEATNQRDFAAWYDGHPFIHIPRVHDDLSTSRVLTTDFVNDARFADMEQASQPERDRAGEAIFRFVLRSIADHHAFNGDPHPGNYLFGLDGTVTFLDFGLVKRLTPQSRDDTIASVVLATIEPDAAALAALCERMGYFTPGNSLPPELIFEFSALLWGHIAEDREFTITPTWTTEVVRTFMLKGERFRELDRYGGLPTDSIILQRITVGLLAVLGRLHATANWHRITRELWLGDAPSTPMGEEEAAWRRELTTQWT
jgi:predicted unusual protein kinase regulating ubiquinone biosynthesis (AarF/ABC1/UbiB family)